MSSATDPGGAAGAGARPQGVRGIGIDVVHLPRIREVIARWQDRFVERVFTAHEIAYCRARRDPIPHFGARFAAKEAALKALGTGLSLGVRWRELEVQRERGRAPRLVLSGRSREIGLARGGDTMLVTLTHDGDYAMAQALLISEGASTAPSESSPRTDCAGEAGARNALTEHGAIGGRSAAPPGAEGGDPEARG